jgi:hypothetical protein
MKSCHTEIIINAPISKVWDILIDVERYPDWNPSVAKIWGTLKEGRLIFAHISPLKNVFPIQIISLKEEQELIWKGTLLNSGIMKGEHYYQLKDLGNGQTKLQHGERFTGLASALIPAALVSRMQANYNYHNQKLKIIAEQDN